MTSKTPTEKEPIETKKAEVAPEEAPAITEAVPENTFAEDEPIEVPTYLPEAGGIAWVELYGKKTDDSDGNQYEIKINLTSRALSPIEALNRLIEAISYAQQYNLKPYSTRYAPKPAETPQAPASAPTIPAPGAAPKAPGIPEPTYEDVEPKTTGVIEAVKMTITPRADGKTKLDFYEEGHQYPDISAVMAPEQLSAMMQAVGAWTPDHFRQIATYDRNQGIHYKISWRHSTQLNRAGNPYKNIVTINPA